jgi:hypothetical protein
MLRNEPVGKDVVGERFKQFCDDLISNTFLSGDPATTNGGEIR